MSKFFIFKDKIFFRRDLFSRDAIRNSWKVFPFVKMAKKKQEVYPNILRHPLISLKVVKSVNDQAEAPNSK